MRDTRAVYNRLFGNAQRETNDMVVTEQLKSLLPFYDTGKPAYYNRAAEALIAGDVQKYQDISDYLMLANGVKEETVRQKVRDVLLERAVAGAVDADAAVALLTENGLAKDRADAYKKVQTKLAKNEHADEEDYTYSVYRSVVEAYRDNGKAAMEAKIKELETNGYNDKTIRTEAAKQLSDAIKSGDLSADDAGKAYAAIYPDKTRDDVYWWTEERRSNAWLDNDPETNYSKYAELDAAFASGNTRDVSDAIKKLMSHGVSAQTAQNSITRAAKEAYIARPTEAMRNKAIQAFMATGLSNKDAAKKVDGWLKPKKKKQ